MTIAILSLAADQKVARPFNRACSKEEVAELLAGYDLNLNLANVDTEEPIGETIRYGQRFKFFAFTER